MDAWVTVTLAYTVHYCSICIHSTLLQALAHLRSSVCHMTGVQWWFKRGQKVPRNTSNACCFSWSVNVLLMYLQHRCQPLR